MLHRSHMGISKTLSVANDIFEFKGHSYLTITCQFNGYIVVRRIKFHTVQETISGFASIFAEFSIPHTILSDCGTNYISSQFADFCKELNITLTYSSTEHHSSNYTECAVQTVKHIMGKSEGDHWEISSPEYMNT